MGISFLKKKAIFTFRTAFSLSFAMKFQRRRWLEDFAWRVERVTQKFRLSRCLFPLYISLLCGVMHIFYQEKDREIGKILAVKRRF
jgi:ABC-type long-subunit fatty acid transport system fused permease/ATPase subunit